MKDYPECQHGGPLFLKLLLMEITVTNKTNKTHILLEFMLL